MMSADVKANIKQQEILRTGWLGGICLTEKIS